MKGGSEADDQFKELQGYFEKNYDFFKDYDYFSDLGYHIEDTYNVNPYNESFLISICTAIALTYVELREEYPMNNGASASLDLFMERLNHKSGIHFPLDLDGDEKYLNRRMYVDFLFKLYDFSKDEMSNQGIQYEMGPTGKKQLADSSFDKRSLRKANQRWYKRTLDDGQRVWKPTEEFEKDQADSKQYALNRRWTKNKELDVNIVGRFSEKPSNHAGVTRPEEEIKARLDTIKELQDEYGVDDEGIYDLADVRLREKGYIIGLRGKEFQIEKFTKIAMGKVPKSRRITDLSEKVKAVRRYDLLKYVPYVLERLILEIDMGQYGKLDIATHDFEYIKERTKYVRLTRGLDIYTGHTTARRELERIVKENIVGSLEQEMKKTNDEHYKDKNITPFHAEIFDNDEILGDIHVGLKMLQSIYQTIDAFTSNVYDRLEELSDEYSKLDDVESRIDSKGLRSSYSLMLSEMDDLLMYHYVKSYLTKRVYEEGVFSSLGEGNQGIFRDSSSGALEYRDNLLSDIGFINQKLKVIELEFYERFLHTKFNTFSWEEVDPATIPPGAKETTMELFAHAEIIRDQLHPTKGNPPLMILPHLREDPDFRFKYYNTNKVKQAQITKDEKNVLLIINHIIFLNGEIFNILQNNEEYWKIYVAFHNKEIDTLYDIAVRQYQVDDIEGINRAKDKYEMKMTSENQLELFEKLIEEIVGATEDNFDEAINQKADGILKERGENIFQLGDILSRLYDLNTSGDVRSILSSDEDIPFPDYDFVSVMHQMKKGNTSDIEYTHASLDSSDPKGDEVINEDSIVDQWLERDVYRISIRENRPDFVQKQYEEYVEEDPFGLRKDGGDPGGFDPFGLNPRDANFSANIPKLKDMDEKQKLRTFKWSGGDELEFMDGTKIQAKQAKELYDMGRGEYLSAQPALSESIRKGGLISNIKKLNREILTSDKPRGDPENTKKTGEVMTMFRELEGMGENFLKRGKPTKTPKDSRALKKGVYKHTPHSIKTIQDLLNKSGYDMVSDFVGHISPELEGNLDEDFPDRFGEPGTKGYEEQVKPVLIEMITEKLEEESLDDSDIQELEDQKLDIYNHGKVVELIDSIDIDVLIDLTYSLFDKYKIQASVGYLQEKIDLMSQRLSAEADGSIRGNFTDEDKRGMCKYIILELIRITEVDMPLKEKGKIFDYNDIFQYETVEYKLAELNEEGLPVIDQYGEPVVDYQKIRSVAPTDFKEKTPEELMTYEVVGKRHGEDVHTDQPLYKLSSREDEEIVVPEKEEGETFTQYYSRMGEESEREPRAQENQGRWGKLPSRRSPSLATMGGGRKRTVRKSSTLKRRTKTLKRRTKKLKRSARKSDRKSDRKRTATLKRGARKSDRKRTATLKRGARKTARKTATLKRRTHKKGK